MSVANAGPPARGIACTAIPEDVDIARVSEISQIEPEQIRGHSREPHIVAARWTWWVLLRERGLSYSRIAKIAGRDHSSVIYAIRRAPECVAVQALLAAVRE